MPPDRPRSFRRGSPYPGKGKGESVARGDISQSKSELKNNDRFAGPGGGAKSKTQAWTSEQVQWLLKQEELDAHMWSSLSQQMRAQAQTRKDTTWAKSQNAISLFVNKHGGVDNFRSFFSNAESSSAKELFTLFTRLEKRYITTHLLPLVRASNWSGISDALTAKSQSQSRAQSSTSTPSYQPRSPAAVARAIGSALKGRREGWLNAALEERDGRDENEESD